MSSPYSRNIGKVRACVPFSVLCTDLISNSYGNITLAHRISKNDVPIHYASRMLNVSERNYSQLDREGLAIIFGVKTFFEYLYGQKFLLQTDNMALAGIFHPEKSIPAIAAARIQRWAIFLTAFHYDIKHIKGTENYADWLSRMPVKDTLETQKDREWADEAPNVYLNNVQKYDFASLDWRQVQRATREDSTLCKIMRTCVDGWPDKSPVEKELLTYWNKREALSVENNCLLWGHRVVIPKN